MFTFWIIWKNVVNSCRKIPKVSLAKSCMSYKYNELKLDCSLKTNVVPTDDAHGASHQNMTAFLNVTKNFNNIYYIIIIWL